MNIEELQQKAKTIRQIVSIPAAGNRRSGNWGTGVPAFWKPVFR